MLGEVGGSDPLTKEEEDNGDWIGMTDRSKGEGGKCTCGERADAENMALKPAENGSRLGERGNGEGRPARLRMDLAEVHTGLCRVSMPGRVAVLDLNDMIGIVTCKTMCRMWCGIRIGILPGPRSEKEAS